MSALIKYHLFNDLNARITSSKKKSTFFLNLGFENYRRIVPTKSYHFFTASAEVGNPAPPILPIEFATTTKDRELIIAQVRGDWVGKLQPGDRVLAVNGDETARFGSRVISHMRGENSVLMKVRRGAAIEVVKLNVPTSLDEVKRAGFHASGMVVGRSTIRAMMQP